MPRCDFSQRSLSTSARWSSRRYEAALQLKRVVEDFFRGRIILGDLCAAVGRTLAWMQAAPGRVFVWLCVTNRGADKVNAAVLKRLGLDTMAGVPGDPKVP